MEGGVVIDGPPRWVKQVMKIVFWTIAAVGGLAASLAVAWIVMVIIAIIGYEIGIWGPPFGGE